MENDLISRQATMDVVEESRRLNHHQNGREACAHEYEHRHFLKILRNMPSAQPEPAIPISWLEKEIERIESRKNSFAVLDAVQLKALIKRWRGEQE